MVNLEPRGGVTAKSIRRVLILADEAARWKVAGLRQLERLLLCLEEYATNERSSLAVAVCWQDSVPPNERSMPDSSRFRHLLLTECNEESPDDDGPPDLVFSTQLFLYRHSIPQLQAALLRGDRFDHLDRAKEPDQPWQYLSSPQEISACERRFLAQSGKSQDGLVSRYLNRPLSRALSRWLLKLPILPTTWSLSIFALPLLACVFFLQGTTLGFIVGCAIYQLYSILDGCDGEIARAKFQQSESGRRLDSFCDLLGNLLLAFSLGIGLAREFSYAGGHGWFYLLEGIIAALLILLSEGIVFVRRARPETAPAPTKWNNALYQRHHEFFERSGILLLGEQFAWWVVQLTKRDMAMLGFLALACLGWTEWILHLQVLVSGISSVLAVNVFLRPAPAVLSEEAG